MCESYGNKANQTLQVIPAAPPPSIPSGLKHRFPLLAGVASTHTGLAQNETDGLDKHFIEEEVEEGGKMKKKRKRERKIKLQQDEEMDILRVNENVVKVKTEMPFQEGIVSEEKKRKKKKKRDIVQDVVEELMVKSEPVDSWSNNVVEGSNKKKKKKKSKIDGD